MGSFRTIQKNHFTKADQKNDFWKDVENICSFHKKYIFKVLLLLDTLKINLYLMKINTLKLLILLIEKRLCTLIHMNMNKGIWSYILILLGRMW